MTVIDLQYWKNADLPGSVPATSGQAQQGGMVSERGVKWSERRMNEVKMGLELKREIR